MTKLPFTDAPQRDDLPRVELIHIEAHTEQLVYRVWLEDGWSTLVLINDTRRREDSDTALVAAREMRVIRTLMPSGLTNMLRQAFRSGYARVASEQVALEAILAAFVERGGDVVRGPRQEIHAAAALRRAADTAAAADGEDADAPREGA